MPTTKELLDMLEHYEEHDRFSIVVSDLREICWKAIGFERIGNVPANTLFNVPSLLETISKMGDS